jgi:hypothetical protein
MPHELILIDATTKAEIGRRPMTSEQERYDFYQVCFERELISFGGKRYKPTRPLDLEANGVWQIPEHNFVMWVTFDSDEATAYDDD